MRRIALFSLIFLIPTLIWANSPSYVLCKNGKQVRTIRVVPEVGQEGCRTAYTKSGKDRIIGMGQHSATCFGFLQNIQQNLEGANWKCRDISHAKLSLSGASLVQ